MTEKIGAEAALEETVKMLMRAMGLIEWVAMARGATVRWQPDTLVRDLKQGVENAPVEIEGIDGTTQMRIQMFAMRFAAWRDIEEANAIYESTLSINASFRKLMHD